MSAPLTPRDSEDQGLSDAPSRAKHTEGPWTKGTCEVASIDFEDEGHYFTIMAPDRECAVAFVPGTERRWHDDPEVDANAALILAAPDLLEALKYAVGRLECIPLQRRSIGQCNAISQGHAAIAQATGAKAEGVSQ